MEAPTLDDSPWVCECELASRMTTEESDTFLCRVKNVRAAEGIDVDGLGVDLTNFDPVIYSGDCHSPGNIRGPSGISARSRLSGLTGFRERGSMCRNASEEDLQHFWSRKGSESVVWC